MNSLEHSVEVFRHARQRQCDERAFMLAAVGIGSSIFFEDLYYVLRVQADEAAQALSHLAQYEQERRPPPPPPPPAPVHPSAWIGCAVYAWVLIGIALVISRGWWRLDAFATGELDAARVQGGQWWRAWTALTLHLDGEHLIGNLAAGCWFGYLAGRLIGAGNAWLLIVAGAGFANLLEAFLGPASHRSVGASTLVFTALGLLSAYSWRLQYSRAQRWALRWAPLVAGAALLSWFGAGGDDPAIAAHVDVVAHVIGFGVGIGLGVLAAQHWAQRALARIPQWLGGAAALLWIAVAWVCALRS